MVGLWLGYQWVHRNASLADVGFCVGFGLVAVGFALSTTGDLSHRLVVAAMAAGYAVRLASYLVTNRIRDVVEDRRYQLLREQWGERAEFYFFAYFVGQALAVAVFSIPLAVLMSNPDPTWHAWEVLGLVIWVIGVAGETVADGQLNQFRRAPGNRGKTCRRGLWRYSRHPNYFFEGMHWCAYVVMSIGLPDWWLTLVGPVVMIGALLKVTGIPLAEAQAASSRGEDYREYQRTTNSFIPWFPKD
ncbi:MAG: DUF1295 domain-containing protein [Nitrospira sp. SB0677_bin_15]|nr:DUF1295 domain-containing protein [Nitrospira sp. SB0667_bin_9]MYD31857.1 DUF1295 domain-containing protein [Nitrospira sp. SB0661_bin_20]MYG39741.1 DUF1295 domain-containing protein [Nitrospira sp. SB0677_bin_15]MYH02365.1 DUF1295 domain-containing protein [Nitrospira sp. SB0675_bin_23]MYJ22439.1 DUF1295 domain-containing protein [Nitrospira sp. SB0673_bin_12]